MGIIMEIYTLSGKFLHLFLAGIMFRMMYNIVVNLSENMFMNYLNHMSLNLFAIVTNNP